MGRPEVLREESSRFFAEKHSANQRRLKFIRERENNFFGPRGKQARIERREARIAEEEVELHEAKKTKRIATRVIDAFSGRDDSTTWEVLVKEIKHLKRFDILIEIENS